MSTVHTSTVLIEHGPQTYTVRNLFKELLYSSVDYSTICTVSSVTVSRQHNSDPGKDSDPGQDSDPGKDLDPGKDSAPRFGLLGTMLLREQVFL